MAKSKYSKKSPRKGSKKGSPKGSTKGSKKGSREMSKKGSRKMSKKGSRKVSRKRSKKTVKRSTYRMEGCGYGFVGVDESIKINLYTIYVFIIKRINYKNGRLQKTS